MRPGVHQSTPIAAAGVMPLLRNWILAATSLGTPFSAAAGLIMAARWHSMGSGISMWRAIAMRPGVHPSAPTPVAMMPLLRDWILAATSLGIRFSARAGTIL